MKLLLLSSLFGAFVQLALSCEVTANGYGSSRCLISLGSQTFSGIAENTCFENEVIGEWSTWDCADGEIAITYYDGESECNSQTGGREESYQQDTCTYSEEQGFYVKVCMFDSINHHIALLIKIPFAKLRIFVLCCMYIFLKNQ